MLAAALKRWGQWSQRFVLGLGVTTSLALGVCAAQSASAAEAELQLLTFNTWGLPAPLGRSLDERVPKIAAAIAGYDLVFLQETFDARFDALPAQTDYPYVEHQQSSSPWRLRSGLMTLSRYPIVHTDFAPFQRCTDADCFAQKGVLLTRIQHPQLGCVDLYNTHYQAVASPEGEAIRRDEGNRVLQELMQRNQHYCPSFLAGDFNFEPDQAAYRDLMARMAPMDLFRRLHPQTVGHTTNDSARQRNAPEHRIDYIFALPGPLAEVTPLSSELKFREAVTGTFLSDHLGVAARVRVRISEWFQTFQ